MHPAVFLGRLQAIADELVERAGASIANAAVAIVRDRVLTTDAERAQLELLLRGELADEVDARVRDAADEAERRLLSTIADRVETDERLHPGATEVVLGIVDELAGRPVGAPKPLKHAADDLRQRLWVAIFDAASEPNDGQEALDRIVRVGQLASLPKTNAHVRDAIGVALWGWWQK